MLAEQKELYNYARNNFEEELDRISPNCVAPLMLVRKIVRTAIYQYVENNCSKDTKAEDIFSQEDFEEVSNKIYNEIMND